MVQRNALLSVFDKDGIVEFAQGLVDLGWKLYSSGGTAKVVSAAGIPVTDVAEMVGGEAILGHRVVTLSREVCAGYLAQYNEDDQKEMAALGLPYIDLVCFNLYPLVEEVASPDATVQSVNDKTDIGGPTALNAGAKSERIVIGDKFDYDRVLSWLQGGEPDRQEFINELAAKAFAITSEYYGQAAMYHGGDRFQMIFGELVGPCKYGENPYMEPAALYKTSDDDPLALHRFEDEGGDARSFVNLTDADSGLQVLTHMAAGFEVNFGEVPLMAVGLKHGNPCGAAVGDNSVEVILKMIAGDKRAIFGGVIMTNFPITMAVAEALMEREPDDPPRLFDGIFAPSFDDGVQELLERKKGKCRMMSNPALAELDVNSLDPTPRFRQVRGGFLTQPNYTKILELDGSRIWWNGNSFGPRKKRDVIMGWAIGCVSVSNTITLVHGGQLIGNGVGQQSRIDAAELAIKRAIDAGHSIEGAAAWSDSFFPAPDGPEALAEAGVGTIFASSGSLRDNETIEACAQAGVILVMQPDKEVRGFAKH